MVEPRERDLLSDAERRNLALARLINQPAGKRLQVLYHRTFGRRWARVAIARRVYVDGIDPLVDQPERGVLLALNHRSFFDLFVVTLALYQVGAKWMRDIYYPVRSNFFYERPLGMAVNLFIGGGTLYPPIFRDPAKASLNREAIDVLARALERPNTMVGLHPEGTRNKNDDPYTLLPAQPGAGQIALAARPLVVPVFVNGMGQSAAYGIAQSWTPNARRDHPIIIVFGRPLDYGDLAAQKPRAALYKRMADRMRDAITALGARERDLRERCRRGEVADDDRGWLSNR